MDTKTQPGIKNVHFHTIRAMAQCCSLADMAQKAAENTARASTNLSIDSAVPNHDRLSLRRSVSGTRG